ncbi:MAG: hypothetical protein V3T31_04650, partial [candidate division Zixibacteria bacterium]
MTRLRTTAVAIFIAVLAIAGTHSAFSSSLEKTQVFSASQAMEQFRKSNPSARAYFTDEQITRLYGTTLATGASPAEAGENFLSDRLDLFGLNREELVAGNLSPEKQVSQPVMYLPESDSYKFTLLYYSQSWEGIPVYDSELRLLIRNETDFPLVWAASSIHPLGDFSADKNSLSLPSDIVLSTVQADELGLTDFSSQDMVIYAGVGDEKIVPRLAVRIEGFSDYPEHFLYVIDPNSGEILYKEDRIVFEDVVGNVSGIASEGPAADFCSEEISKPMPELRLNIDGTLAYTDTAGNFIIPNSGTDSVIVQSEIWGKWFRVFDYFNNEEVLSDTVLPPGPADFEYNSANQATE